MPTLFSGSANFSRVSSPCMQSIDESNVFGDEDCLYLNVYTTYTQVRKKPRPPLPVLVWIHGGSFVEGSSETDIFGPEFILDEVLNNNKETKHRDTSALYSRMSSLLHLIIDWPRSDSLELMIFKLRPILDLRIRQKLYDGWIGTSGVLVGIPIALLYLVGVLGPLLLHIICTQNPRKVCFDEQ